MTALQDFSVFSSGPYQTTSLGYRQLSISTVTTLVAALAAATPPYVLTGTERFALISVETNGIRWIDDGQVPTATYGQPVAAGQAFEFTGNFGALQLVAQSGTATVDISFGR